MLVWLPAACIKGSDEVGGKNPEIIATARARHLNFAVRLSRDRRVAEVARDLGASRGSCRGRDGLELSI
jgi:hypothetical protein